MALGSFTSFTAGTTIVASQMNGNFANITSWSSELARLDGAAFTGACTWTNTITVGSDGTGYDVKFFGDSAGHYMLWDQSADELVLTSDSKLSFHDAAGGENIVASADGHLEVNAGTTLDLTAPTIDLNASSEVNVDGDVDLNGALDVSSTTTLNGNVNVGTNGSGHDVVFHSATADDNFHWDASDEVLKITGTAGTDALSVLFGNVNFDGDLDVDGTTNLDVVDIDGTVNMAADLTINAQILGSNSVPIVYYNGSGAAGDAQKVNDTPQIFVCTATPSFGLADGDIWFDIS